jgi:diguanylate cyclase (GGDEF)-like protein
MELRLYLRMLQRGWWIIVLSTLAALNVALVLAYTATPLYRASARFLVSPDPGLAENSRDLVNSLQALDRRSIIATYAEVLSSNRLLTETGQQLGLAPETLTPYQVATVVLPEASILVLSVQGPDPVVAALLANNLGQQAIAYIRGLYQVFRIDFLDQAGVPLEPFQPQPLRDVSLAVLLGLAVGAVLAILSEQIRAPLDALRLRNRVDAASGAYTRRYFQRRMEETLLQHPGEMASLGLVELSGLHDLYDTLPLPVLHRILGQVTETLRKELRGNDLVGRWDNVRFAVFLPTTPTTAAQRTLQRIQQALARPVVLDPSGDEVRLEPRIGVGARLMDEALGVVIEQAEAALSEIPPAGRPHSLNGKGDQAEMAPRHS